MSSGPILERLKGPPMLPSENRFIPETKLQRNEPLYVVNQLLWFS